MAGSRTLRTILSAAALLACTTLVSGCGGGGTDSISTVTADPTPSVDLSPPSGLPANSELETPVPRSVAIEDAIVELEALPVPEGVNANVYAELKAELRRVLTARQVGTIEQHPPIGERNCVTDLRFADDGMGGYSLAWTYVNCGDYNQNGEVGISDLTPIGVHFLSASGDFDWQQARVADGNGDGEVGISDITPIGQHFLSMADGYAIQSSPTPGIEGSWSDAGFTDLYNYMIPEGGGFGTFRFLVESPESGHCYRVLPCHGMERGSSSNVVQFPTLPTAVLTADPAGGDAPLTVHFDASASYDTDGTIVKYEWDWDGNGSGPWAYDSGPTPEASHTYDLAGTYHAWVRVTDDDGVADTDDVWIAVSVDGNQAPVADLDADPLSGDAPLNVSFSAAGSYDPDGTIVKYEFDFDEGAGWQDYQNVHSAAHMYSTSGTYYPRVRVTDNDGTTDTEQAWITVGGDNEPPVAVLDAYPLSGEAPLQVTFIAGGIGGSYDPDGTIVKYEFDFFGGGWIDYGTTSSAEYTYNAPGTFYPKVRVTDDDGATDAAQMTVTVSEGGDQGDWWMFGREPTHSRHSAYVGAQTNNVKWSYTTGDNISYSSPAIGSDGTVYVGSMDNKLYAINANGSLKWSYPMGASVGSSPAIGVDGTVYVGSHDGKLYAINPDGTWKWSYPMMGAGVRSSPAIGADGTVYVGSDDNKLYAINPDGSLKWSYTTEDQVAYSSPAIGADGTVYVSNWAGKLYAISPDGTEKWTYTATFVRYSPAIGADGTVYIGSMGNALCAINPDGTEKWSYPMGDDVRSSPAIGADGTVYVGSDDYKLYAINSDGTFKWSYTTGGKVDSSPAIGADGTVYVGSDDNKLYAINPDGTWKWSYTTGADVDSSPAIGSDGTVYVGSHDGKLYAFGETASNDPPVADLSASPTSGDAPLSVNFDASDSYDPDGTIVKYEWDWYGNGSGPWDYDSGTDPTVSHTYTTAGTYHAWVKVTDNDGATDTDDVWITANSPSNDPPVADLSASPTSGDAPLSVNFDASDSYDPDGTIVKYEWDWYGNGSGPWDYDSGTDPTVSHTYTTAGSKLAWVKVTDNDGATDTEYVWITVTEGGGDEEWHIVIADDSSYNSGGFTSLAVIQGKPAISYKNYDLDDLMYVRATDSGSNGITWGDPVTVDDGDMQQSNTALLSINGRPAIVYEKRLYSITDGLMYCRASDSIGGSWADPVIVCQGTLNYNLECELEIVNGRPAISFYANGDVDYIRALDSNGGSWPATPILVSEGARNTSMAIVNGRPAIAFEGTYWKIWYARASDINGDEWGSPVLVRDESSHLKIPSMVVANGRPAIAYDGFHLDYVRSQDANGDEWELPIEADPSDDGSFISMAIIEGKPGIAYYNYDGLWYVEASNSSGTSWQSPQQVESENDVGWYCSLAEVNGQPAISYWDFSGVGGDLGNLKYAIYY